MIAQMVNDLHFELFHWITIGLLSIICAWFFILAIRKEKENSELTKQVISSNLKKDQARIISEFVIEEVSRQIRQIPFAPVAVRSKKSKLSLSFVDLSVYQQNQIEIPALLLRSLGTKAGDIVHVIKRGGMIQICSAKADSLDSELLQAFKVESDGTIKISKITFQNNKLNPDDLQAAFDGNVIQIQNES